MGLMLKTNTKFDKGFTIVELLIVIVVIGILAAISVVAYGNIRDRAQDAKMEAESSSVDKAVNMGKAEWGDLTPPVIPGSRDDFLKAYGLSSAKNDILFVYENSSGCHSMSDSCDFEVFDNPPKDKVGLYVNKYPGGVEVTIMHWNIQKKEYKQKIYWQEGGQSGQEEHNFPEDCNIDPDHPLCSGGGGVGAI